MNSNLLAIGISYLYIFFIISVSGLVSKFSRDSSEVSRKIVHIMVGNWIFLTPLFKSFWAIMIVPFSFIIINALSLKYDLFKSMEREDKFPGTVYYAISLTILVGIAYTMNWPILSYAGILIMAYGDGLASIVGEKFGKHYPFSFSPKKSLEGSITVFTLAAIIALGCLMYFDNSIPLAGKIILSLATGFLSAFIELTGNDGCDNLSVPLGAGLFLALSTYFGNTSYYIYMFIVVLILVFAIKKKSLTHEAIVAAFLTAITIYALGNQYLGYALLVFFMLGTIASKIKNKEKQKIEEGMESATKRTWVQVLANSLPATILTWLYLYDSTNEIYLLLAFSVFSAATADTFASELGSLSKAKVYSILNFKEVPKGLSGGVSIPGLFASIVGAMILSIFAIPDFGLRGFIICSILGFLGSIIDSYLGILLQRKYKNEKGVLQDRYIVMNQQPDAGYIFVSNNTVNMATLVVVSMIGYLILV